MFPGDWERNFRIIFWIGLGAAAALGIASCVALVMLARAVLR